MSVRDRTLKRSTCACKLAHLSFPIRSQRMAAFPEFDVIHLERVCDVLADTSSGLTGSEIGRYLRQLDIDDPQPTLTKRHRLFEALSARQRRDRCGNNVVAFVHAAMNPARYTADADYFETKRTELNQILAFSGFELGEDGKLCERSRVTTIGEAEERAGKMRAELNRRGVHPDVLTFCRAELMQRNYFHAVFEATKSVADKVRTWTGLQGDGSGLVDEAFGIGRTGLPYCLASLGTGKSRRLG
jgi:uncharacterized protein Ymh